MKKTWKVGILVATCLMMNGCLGESGRMADLAEKTVESQNEVNSANARAHDNFVNLNREFQRERNDLQTERQSLNKQFEKLESDRSSLHRLRRSELAWSESLGFLAIVIAAIMPLFLCAYLIWTALHRPDHHDEVNSILIRELTSSNPRLIAGPRPPQTSKKHRRITGDPGTPPTN